MDSRLEGWRSILILITFLLTNLIVVFPFTLHFPKRLARPSRNVLVKAHILPMATPASPKWSFTFDYTNVPVIMVLFLLATTAIDGSVVRRGIVGDNGIQPLDIMALFISLAYLSISLDATGLLRFLAFWVTQRGGSSGRKLYFYLYLFFFTSGVIIGNDPVVLSGTAFLAYLTRISGIIPPTAWTYAQFAAANVASAVLVSSNPTNLVISGAFTLAYTNYTAFVIIPTIFSAIFMFPVLWVLFKIWSRRINATLIPHAISLPELGGMAFGRSMLVDKPGAIIGSFLLITTLVVLVATSPLKPTIPVWRVTVPGAVLMLIRDLIVDHARWRRDAADLRKQPRRRTVDFELTIAAMQKPPTPPTVIDGPVTEEPTTIKERESNENKHLPHSESVNTDKPIDPLDTLPPPAPMYDSNDKTLMGRLMRLNRSIDSYFPTACNVIRNLPVALLPFAFSMFILVQGLSKTGWVEIFASWWTRLQNHAGVAGSVFIMTLLSSLLCNICGTNIGTTILLAQTLQRSFSENHNSIPFKTNPIIFALAFGTNIGAFTFTFSASLAGLLWRGILRQKGIHVPRSEFATLNGVIWATAAVVGSVVLVIQHKIVN